MTTFVVCRDSDVDEFGRGVGIAESDDGNVDVGGFFDGLGIGARVRYNDEAGLFEGASDVVGKVTGSETTSNSDGAGVGGELEDSALTVGTSRDDGDISGVVYCGDDASCQDDFLPIVTKSAWAGRILSKMLESYQVLPILITLIPSGRVFQRYGSM